MLPSEKIGNEFYQSLGKLFYAVAMADKNVRPVDNKHIKQLIFKTADDIASSFANKNKSELILLAKLKLLLQ